MLRLSRRTWLELVGHCLDGLPLEACGLFGGHPDGRVEVFYPCRNAAASARVYEVDPRDHLRADPEALAGYAAAKKEWQAAHRAVDAYADAKEPWFDVEARAAEEWASSTGWHPSR